MPLATPEFIEAIVGKIRNNSSPEKIILFGSDASVRPHEDSDVDLLIVMPSQDPPLRRRIRLRRALRDPERRIPIELLALTPEEVRAARESRDPFLTGILDHGRVLYEA